MKKIFFLILALCICCATCSAEFNPPNPERWELFKDTGNILCYFNREAVEITEQPYGRSAKVWVTTYDVTIKIEAMMDWELNLDTEEWRMLSGNIYDEEGNELLATANPEEFKAIPKGSVIEDLYLHLGGREKHTEEPESAAAEDKDINKGEAETPKEAGEAEGAEKAAPEGPETAAAEDKDVNKGEPQAAPEEPQAAPEEPQAAPEGPESAAAEDKDINQGEPQAAPEESQAAPEGPETAAAEDKDMNQGEPQAAPEEPEAAPEAAPGTADAAAPAEAGAEV